MVITAAATWRTPCCLEKKEDYGDNKGSGQCKKRKEVYSRTALSNIVAAGQITAMEHSQLNWSKLRCSVGIKYTLDFEDSDQKEEFKISLIIIICTS